MAVPIEHIPKLREWSVEVALYGVIDDACCNIRFTNRHVASYAIGMAGQAHVPVGSGSAERALLFNPLIPITMPQQRFQFRQSVSTGHGVTHPDRMKTLGSCARGVFTDLLGQLLAALLKRIGA